MSKINVRRIATFSMSSFTVCCVRGLETWRETRIKICSQLTFPVACIALDKETVSNYRIPLVPLSGAFSLVNIKLALLLF